MAVDYWQKRIAKTQYKLTQKNIDDTEYQLNKAYKQASIKMANEFDDLYHELLDTMDAGAKPTPADLYKLQKYWDLQNQLNGTVDTLGQRQIKIIESRLMKEYRDIYDSINFKNRALFNTLADEAITHSINSVWCADNLVWSERVWGNTARLKATLLDELSYSISTGRKPGELRQQLQNRFAVSRHQASTLVRTEMAHVQTAAAKQRYKDYGIQYVKVLADDAYCDVCKKFEEESKPYLLDQAPQIPAHPNCRCCIVPVVD